MKAVIQAVSSAQVAVHGELVGQIVRGIMVLAGVEKGDSEAAADWWLRRSSGLRNL